MLDHIEIIYIYMTEIIMCVIIWVIIAIWPSIMNFLVIFTTIFVRIRVSVPVSVLQRNSQDAKSRNQDGKNRTR